MKIFNQIISLLMVALMIVTAAPFVPVSAVDDMTESYDFTLRSSCADAHTAGNSTEGRISFFSVAEFDVCFGNQLSGLAREIYDSMVKNYSEDKITEKYTYTLKVPYIFDAEVSDGSIVVNEELKEIDLEIKYSVQAAMDAFLYDHPEVFWLKKTSSSYGVSASGNSEKGYIGTVKAVTVKPTEIYSGAASNLSRYEAAVDSAMASVNVTESRYDTLKIIHDYICNNAWYNLVSENRVHSSEAFFVGDGGVVCEGYAKAFKVFCDRLDIPCVLVSGDADGAHMWNYVQMDDGKWYLVDVTWDDQDGRIYDTYFIADAGTVGFRNVAISEERTERNDFSATGIYSFSYPKLSVTGYGVHTHEWESDYTVDSEPTCTEKGSKSIHCRLCDKTMSVTEIPALEHSWNDGEINSESTCRTHGIKTYTCRNDAAHQYTEQLPFDKNSHEGGTYLKNTKEATCSSAGYTGDIYCSACNTKLSSGEILPFKPHSFIYYISDGNATCLADGTKTSVCDVCNKATDTVPDEGSRDNARHKYSVHYEINASCTQDGERTYVCDVCDTAAYMEILTATGHKGGTATCKNRAVCTACGEEYGTVNEKNHNALAVLKAVEATCTGTGLTEGEKCTDCGKVVLAQKTVAKKSHTYKRVITKAAISKNGKSETVCTACGYVSKTTAIYAPKTVKLSAASYTYNGKIKTPDVTVKDSKGRKLKKGTDYTVKYSKGRKSPGKYTVTVTFKGNYSGAKKLNFEILPAKVTLSKLTAGPKTLTAAWKTVSGVTGYEVQYSVSKNFTKKTTKTVKINSAKSKKITIKKLTKGKKYYVRVRAVKAVGGKKLYGTWSSAKNVKVK